MLLGNLQALLTEYYDLDLSCNIYDFLTTDGDLASALDAGGRDIDEKLLIAERDGEADVALYLCEELIGRLEENDPWLQLNDGNLADFWVAFEGVSHFIHFAWRASIDMPVSLLELELQAEVDKFIATAILLRRQGRKLPDGLHRWLFDRSRLSDALSEIEIARYEQASYYAGKYCLKLEPELARERLQPALRNELRRFYRLARPAKIGHIESR